MYLKYVVLPFLCFGVPSLAFLSSDTARRREWASISSIQLLTRRMSEEMDRRSAIATAIAAPFLLASDSSSASSASSPSLHSIVKTGSIESHPTPTTIQDMPPPSPSLNALINQGSIEHGSTDTVSSVTDVPFNQPLLTSVVDSGSLKASTQTVASATEIPPPTPSLSSVIESGSGHDAREIFQAKPFWAVDE